MHLPPDTPYLKSLTASQRFCVEIWHGQTFSASLDSYRVRLHNGRTILKELQHEIEIQIGSGPDLQVIALEAMELCKNDEALKSCLGTAFDLLLATLSDLQKDKAVTEAKNSTWSLAGVKKLRFILEDTLKRIEEHYLAKAVETVRNCILNDPHPFNLLKNAVSCLLTDLVDRGWTLESLHEWALNLGGQVIKFQGKVIERSFEERLTFAESLLMCKPQAFRVCLRLSGGPNLGQLGVFKGFHFSSQPPQLAAHNKDMQAYLRANAQTSFAICQINAVDFKSACHAALETFEDCLDRLRFNFLDTKLQLDPRVLVIREGDNRSRLERVAFPVPNPVFTTNLAQFRKDSERIDDLLRNDTLDQISRERITAAARQYRLGQDADSYRDKLLNWWFGLEYLTKITNQGSIGGAVTQHGKNCMMSRYFLLLLLDLVPSIKAVIGTWPASVTTLLACAPDSHLQPEKLLLVMQDPVCRGEIGTALSARPWLQVRFQELAEVLSDAKKLSQYVETHGQRVEWQLKRLYRVRCCLVHGSPMILRLMLLCANLEFYLRETMVIILRTMLYHPQISSLEDFFDRLRIALDRRAEGLKALPAGTAPGSSCCFDGITTSTKP